MPRQPFRKAVANFAKGFATYLGELDIPSDVFLIYKNLSNFFPGKIKKSAKDIRITENFINAEIPTNGKEYVILYKSSWTITKNPNVPENKGRTYYLMFVQVKDTADIGILIHEASDTDKDSDVLLADSWEWWSDDIGWGIDPTEDIDIDFFVGNGSVRISDSNMNTNNISKWFGHIKRNVFGQKDATSNTDGNELYMMSPSPSKPNQAEEINKWEIYDQHIKPPANVKLTSYLDRDNICKNVGDVGVFVQDPWLNTRRFTGDVWEDTDRDWWGNFCLDAMVWPDTDSRTTFSEKDRYAVTYVYDYASESELSRDEFGNLGISGFPCYKPPNIVLEQEDTMFSKKIHENVNKVQNYLEFESRDDLQSLIGKVIRINSEKMYVIRGQNGFAGGFSNNVVTVMRGVLGTSPQEHTGDAGTSTGDDIFFVQETQPARAVSIVVNTGAKSCTSREDTGNISAILNASGDVHYLKLKTNKRLGLKGKLIRFTIEHTTTGFDVGTMGANTFEIAMIRDGSEIEIKLKCDNGGGRTFTCQQILDIINTGTCSGKTGVFPGVVPGSVQNAGEGLTAERFVSFFDEASFYGSGTLDGSPTATQAVDVKMEDNGSNSSEDWNSRITGINLYWNPEGETDFYLVNSYDINTCLVDSPVSLMKKSYQAYTDVGEFETLQNDETNAFTHQSQADTSSFYEENQAFSGNTGAWIETPFSSPLFTIGNQGTGLGDGGSTSTYNWSLCNRWGVVLSPQDNNTTGYPTGADPTITVRNPVACPNDTIILTSAVGKQFQIQMNYTTDLIHTTYYGSVNKRDLTNGSLNNTVSDRWQSTTEDTAFFGGVALNTKSTGETLGNLTFDSTANTIKIGINNVRLGRFGYKEGDFIFVATADTSLSVNGMYKIADISNGDYTDDMITVDTSFRPIPSSGVFPPAKTFMSGTKYLANDAGLALSYPPMHGFGVTDVSIGQGYVVPIDTDGSFGNVNLNNPSACTYGYFIEGFLPRQDVIGTRRIPHYGFKGINYRDRLDRASKDRFAPVRWSCSTQISGISVIGNVDVMDENEQTVNERGKILWTSPYKFDEFTLANSRTIGKIDADPIVALEGFNGVLFVVKESDTFLCDPSKSFNEVGVLTSMGTKWKSAVVSTSKGVCVANESGIFLLPEGQQLSLPILDTYQKLTFKNPILSYSPKKNNIVFIPDTSEQNAQSALRYIYSFDRNSWIEENCDDSESPNNLSKIGSFFIGDTGFLEYLSQTVYGIKVSRVPSTFNDSNGNEVASDSVVHLKESPFQIKSKNHTFDDPSQRKYIEYMYITYKFGANIKLKVYTDGNQVGEILLPAHNTLKNRKIPIKREGKTFQYELVQNADSSLIDLQIEDIIIEGFYSGKQ